MSATIHVIAKANCPKCLGVGLFVGPPVEKNGVYGAPVSQCECTTTHIVTDTKIVEVRPRSPE